MITIIDYGLGNVQAFLNTYKYLGIPVKSAKSASDLKDASHIILPGVGSFDQAITLFENSGMKSEVEKMVIEDEVPILGICVGMQILANYSEEGSLKGLGWINGNIKKIKIDETKQFPLPHMGWNDIHIKKSSELFFGLELNSSFYFLHSFYFDCFDSSHEVAEVFYDNKMTCAVKKDNIYGVQFHPEKSHNCGTQLLKNFSNI